MSAGAPTILTEVSVVFFCSSRQMPAYYLESATTTSFEVQFIITPSSDAIAPTLKAFLKTLPKDPCEVSLPTLISVAAF
jgi:hypothetical protein